MVNRVLFIVTALALLVSSGIVHGLWTDRWGTSAVLDEAAARVDAVPLQIGAWHGELRASDPEAFQRAGAHACWTRQYTHATRKAPPITVVLMCGRAGRMAVHTPEVCYGEAGFALAQARRSVAIPLEQDEKANFWSARFVKDGPAQAGGAALTLLWSWSDGSGWQAPASPRWHFRGAPYLYKLYVVQEHGGGDDAASDFLPQFLPSLERTLFPRSS